MKPNALDTKMIEELRKLHAARTQERWYYKTGPSLRGKYQTVQCETDGGDDAGEPEEVMICECYDDTAMAQEANARFIAAAANAMPRLLDLAEATIRAGLNPIEVDDGDGS